MIDLRENDLVRDMCRNVLQLGDPNKMERKRDVKGRKKLL